MSNKQIKMNFIFALITGKSFAAIRCLVDLVSEPSFDFLSIGIQDKDLFAYVRSG